MNSHMLFGIVLTAFPILLSLTLHEYGHARTALAFGDRTALLMGRVSLNPLVHLDPIGTLCLFFGPIGWAKPVPVNTANLYPRRWGNFCVSIAGVCMNLLLAGAAIVTLNILGASGLRIGSQVAAPTPVVSAVLMLIVLMLTNLSLAVFNLIPLAPLDGHHVLGEMLPPAVQPGYQAFQQRMGRTLLMGLVFLGFMSRSAGLALNPLGTLMDWTVYPLLRLTLTDHAFALVGNVMGRFHSYLLW
jgi:Zn-dependent protease